MSYLFLITSAVVIISLIYYYFNESFKYLEKRNIPSLKPSIPFGNLQNVGRTVPLIKRANEVYSQFKKNHKLAGMYFFTAPRILPIDLDLIKHILIKDFSKFRDRGLFYDTEYEPIGGHLFNLHSEKWSEIRKKLSPTFTSGKMKMMFPIIASKTNDLSEYMKDYVNTKKPLDIKDVFVRYSSDVIASCAFGFDSNCLKLQNDDFMREAKRVFDYSGSRRKFELFIQQAFPKLAHFLKLRIFPIETQNYFMKIVSDAVGIRETNQINNHDFLSLLLDIHKHGIVKGESDEQVGKITFNEMAAQAFIFLVAGYETTSTCLYFAMYEIARNQDIQQRAREEVKNILEKHNGEFTYEAVMEMTYIQQIINESLRRYPPIVVLFREAYEDYKVPDSEVIIPKGIPIVVPVYSIHMNPDIYPEPEIFDPERFTPENIKSRHPFAFLPFGDGPRNCIGMRFAILEARLGLAALLLNYKFTVNDKTDKKLEMDPTELMWSMKNGIWLNVEKI